MMDQLDPQLLCALVACICGIAILYSSVGHGGASGYIATLALFSVPMAQIKPTALLLNIVVSAVATTVFTRSGNFSWRIFWPFAATSVPFSFIGGALNITSGIKPMIGIVLLYSAYRLFAHERLENQEVKAASIPISLVIGAALGFLSGLTGVGGGIFLSPLLLLLKWAGARETSAVAALFILVNSIAGLAGHLSNFQTVPDFAPMLGIAAFLGGIVGSSVGSRMPVAVIARALSAVLLVAGIKLMAV